MILVAIVAAGLWAIAMKMRSDRYRAYSEYLAERERRWRAEAEASDENAIGLEHILANEINEENKKYWCQQIDCDRRNSAECREEADILGSVKRRYARAARYPWLMITPEPPEPFFPAEPPSIAFPSPPDLRPPVAPDPDIPLPELPPEHISPLDLSSE
jgi:hypothetical protein